MGKLKKQKNWSVNGVIVTVYEESSTVGPRSRKIRSTNSKPITRSCGYDRRAELLAYAHHLRNVDPQQIHQDHSPTPTPSNLPNKPKKRRRLFARLKELKFSFRRLFGGEKNKPWKYKNVQSREREIKYRSCPSPRRGKGNCSKISKRLRRVLKQFSCGCNCSKEFDQNDEQFQDLHNTGVQISQ